MNHDALHIGVESLSFHEIHSDLCELQRLLSPETDGDSSVDSEDVVESHYPVKPRRSIRVIEREEVVDFEKTDVTITQIEHALFTIKRLMSTHKEICAAEEEREELEATAHGYTSRLTHVKSEFSEQRSGQELYLRLHQALLLRSLATMKSYGNALHLYELIRQSLQHFRLNSRDGPSQELKCVRLEDSLGKELVVLGATVVRTSYGEGVVTNFDATSNIFSLSLPYATIHCAAATLLLWLRREAAAYSVRGVLDRFHSHGAKHLLSALPRLSEDAMASGESDVAANDDEENELTDADESETDPPSPTDDQQLQPPLPPVASETDASRGRYRQKMEAAKGWRNGGSNPYLALCPAAFVPTSSTASLQKVVALAQAERSPLLLDGRALDRDDASLAIPGRKRSAEELSGDQVVEGGFFSGQGHCWRGDVKRMRTALADLRAEAQALEKARSTALGDLLRRRAAALQLSTQNAALRLKMFTRRHCQRTLLANQPAPAASSTLVASVLATSAGNQVADGVGVEPALVSEAAVLENVAQEVASSHGGGAANRSSRSRHRANSLGGTLH